MTTRNFNNVTTVGTLTAPVATTATTLTVSNFNTTPTTPFTATIDRNTATEEIVLITALAAGTATAVRGYDGTAAQAHSAGALIEHTAGAIEYVEANRHVNATTNVHGITGNVVGDQGSQTLFDKTLVSPVMQANVTSGDASVAYIPPGAETKKLYSGIGSDGNTKFSVSSSGNIAANAATFTGQVSGITPTANAHLARKDYVDNAVSKRMASGAVTINITANNTPTSAPITYGQTFASPPAVVVTANSSVPGTGVSEVTVTNVTTTGCNVVLTRATGSGNTTVYWIAML